jgi:hypothetical protein
MKKITALILFSFLTALSLRADVIWQELFNYTNGPIINTSTNGLPPGQTNWIRHSGTASPSDAIVNNHRLENSATVSGGTLNGPLMSRQDDVHRFFTAAYTNAVIPVYASFIINCTNLPNAAGTYFAHFYTNSTVFQGKVIALAGTNLCLPNTFRLGVAGAASSANQIFPIDLAMNHDYQVVIEWDPAVSYSATLWVNPVSAADTAVVSSDAISGIPCPPQAFAFRQASTFGNWFCSISNLVTATTFAEAATNVWASNSIPPSIAYDLKPSTNFVGNPVNLSIVAAGQGLSDFYYQWQMNGVNIANPNGNTNVFTIPDAELGNAGNYSVVVSNLSNGQFATSASVLIWVTNGPPVLTVQPTNQTVYLGKNVTVSVTSLGTPPLSYSWTRNGNAIMDANVDPTTTNTSALVINDISPANTNGTYKCNVSNAYGSTNTVAIQLNLLTPQVVNIDFLHGQVDSTFFLPTNTTIYYTVTNAVVYTHEVTNADGSVNGGPYTGPANGEFYIQDGSGGICVFDAGGTIQPRVGDIVTVTGPLSQFNSLLEFNVSTTDPSTSVTITGHTNTLPAPVVLPLTFTNGSGAFISVSNVVRHYEGRYVTLTNVYFPGGSVGANFASGNYVLTNLNGDVFTFFLNAANVNVIGQPVPQFASKVSGALGYYNGATTADRSAGFEIDPSTYSDIVAGPNPPQGVIVVTGGGVPVINWAAQPFVPYSVLWSTNVAGPYTAIATGLTFTSVAGTYTDSVNTGLPTSFYKISSP